LNEPELTELLVGESVISRDLTSCWLSCGALEWGNGMNYGGVLKMLLKATLWFTF